MKLLRFFTSSVGLKVIMAITGLILGGFVFFHMLGNLQIFLGQDALNKYALFLQSVPAMIFPARIVLLLSILIHIAAAIKLNRINSAARPIGYILMDTVEASLASRYMLQTGIIIALFVVFHLMHFTFGIIQPEFAHFADAKGRHDVYSMVIAGFQSTPYAIAYIAFMLIIAFHFIHAIPSLLQTMGINHPKYNLLVKRVASALVAVIALGYVVVPLSVTLGILTLPEGVI